MKAKSIVFSNRSMILTIGEVTDIDKIIVSEDNPQATVYYKNGTRVIIYDLDEAVLL